MSRIVRLVNVDKSYGQEPMIVPVLHKINLEVQEGEYIAIMGPSGSGKSTLMNIIGCLDRATAGSYFLDEEDINTLNDNALSDIRLHKIGFVFQTFNLLPGETALENTALPLIYAGIKKADREVRALEELKKVGLQERAGFYPNQLSGGQKQRVAIARAMINHPKLLLADEPTGALDQESGKQVMKLFDQLHEQGVTIVMITHDINVAKNAQKIMYIIDGRLSENEAVSYE